MPKEIFFADERRAKSGEIDFGVWWRDGSEYPTYRVSFIVDTGELYALDMQETNAELIGVIEGANEEDRRATVEAVLEGWADKCGQLNSLSWVRRRVK